MTDLVGERGFGDLGCEEGVRLFHDLVRRSDVVLENFRASSAARLGVDAEQLLAVNPRLVLLAEPVSMLRETLRFSAEPPAPIPLVREVITKDQQ